MCLKNRIISGLLVLALAVVIMPAVTKAAEPSLADLQAQIQALQQQIEQLVQKIASMSNNASFGTGSQTTASATKSGPVTSGQYVFSNSPGNTYSSTTYQNPADCPAPAANANCGSPYTGWAKSPNTGGCCQYAASCQSPAGWNIYSTQEGCQAAKTSCLISGDSCCQNGKCYPLTNTCTNGTTPYISVCQNYGSYCVPVTGCAGGDTAVAANCDQECKTRGFASGSCTWSEMDQGLYLETINTNPYANSRTIGKTTDCINNLKNGVVSRVDRIMTKGEYCACNLADEPNFQVPSCEALCNTQGYNFGSCHVLANSTNMVCSGGGETVYAGTTNVCKSGGPTWTAGCCCFAISRSGSDGGITAWGVTTPTTPTASKANGQQCASNTECSSGNCSYTYCAPANYCGGVANPMYFASGATATNQWFSGVCRNGVWKTSLNQIGCNPAGLNLACDSGTCINNKCVSVSGATAKANGQQCSSGSQCSSGYCNCGYCVPGSSYCGSGLPPNNYVASGEKASYGTNYFNGVCNNGVWNVVGGGYGCTVTNSACSPSTLSCVSGYTCNTSVANGKCQ